MNTTLRAVLSCVACTLASAFLGATGLSAQTTPLWMRYAQISPDGKKIVFTYKGDLFVVSTQGGTATRLTATSAYETRPKWSPDGTQIAFMSNRDGASSIYIMPAQGGAAKRITKHGLSHELKCFTPKGDAIVFTGDLQTPAGSAIHPGIFGQTYQVPVTGGIPQLLGTYPAHEITFNASGSAYLIEDLKGFENRWRKHHTSSVTRDIYLISPRDNKVTPLTTRPGEDLNPVFSPDEKEVFFLSERSGNSLNVWSMSASSGDKSGAKQITKFKNHPVRFLSIANNGTLAYTYDGELYTQKPGADPQKVSVNIIADFAEQQTNRMVLSSGINSFATSQDGKQMVFTVRGEVFAASIEHGTTKRITETAAQESSVLLADKDRSVIYVSFRNGKHDLYKTSIVAKDEPNFFTATMFKEELLIPQDKSEKTCPKLSPDGKEIAYLSDRKKLVVYNFEKKQFRTITDGSGQLDSHGQIDYSWSPDGKWIAMEYVPRLHAPYSDIGIVSAQGGEVHNLTNSGYFSSSPRWVMGGEALIFSSERLGMRNHASWGSMNDVFMVFMNRKGYEKFRMNKEEYDLYMASGADSIPAIAPVNKADTAKNKDIMVEWKDIEDRVVRLTPNSSDLGDAYVDNKGSKLYYLTSFEGGYNLWTVDLREGTTEMLRKMNLGGAMLIPDAKGEKLFICSSQSIQSLNLSNNKVESHSFRAELEFDPYEERQAMYNTMAHEEKVRFYRKDMHGVNWDALTEHYRKFLPHIANSQDFAELMSEILGELNVSHTGGGYSGGSSGKRPGNLGLLFDLTPQGKEGITIEEVLAGGPFDSFRSKVQLGDRIVAIDGQRLDPKKDYHELLLGKIGIPVRVTLLSKNGEEYDEVIRPVSNSKVDALLYKRWVRQRAAEVERLSGGRLGYVHISSMGDDSFRKAYSEALGRYNNKEGIVIDIRYNGGGRLHEDVEVLFSGTPYLMQQVRGEDYCVMPSRRWTKPSVMLVCEADYSNAHGTPWVYQTQKIGKVVGMPVPGTMTSVNWVRLQDPSLFFGIPIVGYKTLQGNYLENTQLEPDVLAPQDYQKLDAGEDVQLRKAVEVLLKEIAAKPQPKF